MQHATIVYGDERGVCVSVIASASEIESVSSCSHFDANESDDASTYIPHRRIASQHKMHRILCSTL